MSDPFANRHRAASDPVVQVFEITPDDGTDLSVFTTALNVATPGTVRLTTVEGTTSDILIHPGHAFPIRAKRIWQTGTTATGIRGLA